MTQMIKGIDLKREDPTLDILRQYISLAEDRPDGRLLSFA
jgi:hypothetical protein